MKKRWIIPILVLLLVSLACTINLPNKDSKNVDETEEVTVEETEEQTEEVTQEVVTVEPTIEVPTESPTLDFPTEEPTMAPSVTPASLFFTDDFDGDLSNWQYFIVTGDPNAAYVTPVAGKLRFELPRNVEAYVYAYNTSAEYQDVYVETNAETIKTGRNGIAIVCRMSDQGWYELRVSTAGYEVGRFAFYRYDSALKAQKQNPYVNLLGGYPNLASVDLKNGANINTLGLLCYGNQIIPFINGVQPKGADKQPLVITDNTYSSGYAGIGAMSYAEEAVTIDFDWVTTSEP
jgi:hypothetical protein